MSPQRLLGTVHWTYRLEFQESKRKEMGHLGIVQSFFSLFFFLKCQGREMPSFCWSIKMSSAFNSSTFKGRIGDIASLLLTAENGHETEQRRLAPPLNVHECLKKMKKNSSFQLQSWILSIVDMLYFGFCLVLLPSFSTRYHLSILTLSTTDIQWLLQGVSTDIANTWIYPPGGIVNPAHWLQGNSVDIPILVTGFEMCDS